MKIRAKGDNCACWSKGDEFEVHICDEGLTISCHLYPDKPDGHYLLDIRNRTIHNIQDSPDFEVIHA